MRSRDLQEVSEEGKFVIDFKNGDCTSQAVSLFSTGQMESTWVWILSRCVLCTFPVAVTGT